MGWGDAASQSEDAVSQGRVKAQDQGTHKKDTEQCGTGSSTSALQPSSVGAGGRQGSSPLGVLKARQEEAQVQGLALSRGGQQGEEGAQVAVKQRIHAAHAVVDLLQHLCWDGGGVEDLQWQQRTLPSSGAGGSGQPAAQHAVRSSQVVSCAC